MKPSMKTLAFLVTALLVVATSAGRLAAQEAIPAASNSDLVINEAAELLVGLDVSASVIRDIKLDKITTDCRQYDEGTACIVTYRTRSEQQCRAVAGLALAAQAAEHYERGDKRPFVVRVLCGRHQVDALWTHGVVGVVDKIRQTQVTTYSTVIDRRTSRFAA